MFNIKNILMTFSVLCTSSIMLQAMEQPEPSIHIIINNVPYKVMGYDDGSITLCSMQDSKSTSLKTFYKSRITTLTSIKSVDGIYILFGFQDGTIKCCSVDKDIKLVPVKIGDYFDRCKHNQAVIKLFATKSESYTYVVSYAKDDVILWHFMNSDWKKMGNKDTLHLCCQGSNDIISVSCTDNGLLSLETKSGVVNYRIHEHKFVRCDGN